MTTSTRRAARPTTSDAYSPHRRGDVRFPAPPRSPAVVPSSSGVGGDRDRAAPQPRARDLLRVVGPRYDDDEAARRHGPVYCGHEARPQIERRLSQPRQDEHTAVARVHSPAPGQPAQSPQVRHAEHGDAREAREARGLQLAPHVGER